MAKRGWFGEKRRHSKAAKLGWRRRDMNANGTRSRFVKHLAKKGGRKVKRGARFAGHVVKEGAKKTGRAAVEAGKEVAKEDFPTAYRKGKQAREWVGREYQDFLEMEEDIDEEVDDDLEDSKYTHVKGHVRKKPVVKKKKVVKKKPKKK